jgi:2-dehydro-3-deoxyglucarate aldolase
MDGNPLREALANGETVIGARAVTASPTIVDTYGSMDLDFVWLDTEHTGHSPYDSLSLNQLVRASRAADIEPFLRLSDSDPAMVRNVLDAGIRSILLPRVKTAERTREVLAATKYVYDDGPGERGVGASLPNNWGERTAEYVRESDETILAGVLIETESAVEQIDEILAVPGIDFVFLGPGDLSVSMNYPMETEHPEVRAALARVRKACAEADVPVGGMAGDVDSLVSEVEAGTQIIRVGDDVPAVRETIRDRLATVREAGYDI